MTEDQLGTVELFTRELGRALEPIVTAAEAGPEGVRTFLEAMGFDEAFADGEADKFVSFLDTHVAEPAAVLAETVLADDPSLEDLDEVIDAIASVNEGIQKLDEIDVPEPDVDDLGVLVLDHLLVTYLENYHGTAYNALSLFGVIVDTDGPGAGDLDFSGLGTLLQNPNELPKEVFNWADDQEDFLGALVLYYLKGLAWRVGLPASIEGAPPEQVETLANVTNATDLDPQLRIPILSYTDGQASTMMGVKIVPLPGRSDCLPGMAVVPFGQAAAGDTINLGGGWTFNVEVSGSLDSQGFGVCPPSGGGLNARVVDVSDGSSPGSVHGEATLEHGSDGSDDAETVLLGQPDGTRLALNSIGATATVDYEDEVEFGAELPASATLAVQPEGGFLGAVLPDDLSMDFDATTGWSNLEGLYFEGGATLEATIPTHVDLGPVALGELYLALQAGAADDGGDGGAPLTFETATSPSLEIGPLVANVKRLGVSADVSFPESGDGNLGIVDVDVGFRPPDGIGLSVDAGAVAGGGYLEFEPEKHRYAGTFELSFGDYSVTIVGLLKTRLPGGQDGFSLLLLVTGQLPPIQLGFGFTLNGIGGLVGAHRDMRKRPLGEVVRSGNLDSVLFPEDVVANADQIISDLRSIFPPKTDVFVVGPMAKFGWGTPTIIEMDVGVVLAIPRWKIAILGKIAMALPDDDLAMIELNLAVVGFLDIPGKKLSIDASLYDSRIVMWDVSGDMAMRSSWGKQSRFMLSVGGFHPRFEPPKSFPELRRITASLGAPDGNPSIEYTGYLAVTPNSFQVGAGVELSASAGPARVDGELSFDALFRFNPFEFVVDFFAKLAVAIKSFELGIEIDGTLSGPQPWRIKGDLNIKIAFISMTVSVDVSLGSDPGAQALPSAKVMPELERALGQAGNWDAQRPEGLSFPVSLRDPTTDGEDEESGADGEQQPQRNVVLVHPLGTIRVRQTVVPLGLSLEKYGNAKPVNARFRITALSMSGNDLPEAGDLREKFAPAKFKEMSDSEKLDTEGFESYEAGRVVENDLCYYTGQVDANASSSTKRQQRRLVKAATLSYESSIIDEEEDNYRLDPADVEGWDSEDAINVHDTHRLANTDAVARSDVRTTGSAKYENRAETTRESTSHTVSSTGYVVVSSLDLTRVDMTDVADVSNPATGTTQIEARETRDAFLAANPDREVTVVATHQMREDGGS